MSRTTHIERKTSSPVLSPLGTGRTRRQRARSSLRSEVAERARAEVLHGSAASLCARVSVCGGEQRMADWRGKRIDGKNVRPSSAGGVLRMRPSALMERVAIYPVVVRERQLRDPNHAQRAERVLVLTRSRLAAPLRMEKAEARLNRLILRHGGRAKAGVRVRARGRWRAARRGRRFGKRGRTRRFHAPVERRGNQCVPRVSWLPAHFRPTVPSESPGRESGEDATRRRETSTRRCA
jgi:hypothetical protein